MKLERNWKHFNFKISWNDDKAKKKVANKYL